MRLEREDDRVAAEVARSLERPPHDRGVPEVKPIEVAERDDRITKRSIARLEVPNDAHCPLGAGS